MEDDEDDAGRIQRMLRGGARRYDVTLVASGQAARAALREDGRRFDCVLLDYNLPDLDGLELLRSMRGERMAVMVLTGRDDDEIAAQMLEAGAEDYLLKDALMPHALARAIENVIEKAEIRRQLEAQRAAAELRSHRLELTRDELRLKVGELAAATQARDRFMAMMSHEMRTPLNAILGYTELLGLEIDGALSPAQRGQLERIRVGSRHLLDLINDVLDLSRADADKLELDVRPVDVAAVIDEVHALLEIQAEQRQLRFVVDPLPAELPPALADLQRLRQILMNLAGNAIKFTESGSVTISAAVDDARDVVRIMVADTGIGMDEEVRARAFEEFYQADGALTRRRGGSGLGLAISRRLARAMGGDIEVASREGSGSTFTLRLPVARGDGGLRAEDVARHGARMALHASSNEPPRPARAAVAVAAFGDDAPALEALSRQVQPSVRLVWTTTEGELAPLAMREGASLVILDIAARGGAAWRVAHTLSELPADRAPAVLLLPSIVPTGDSAAPGVDLGWVSLVPKPFTAMQLTRAVATAAGHEGGGAAQPRLDVIVIDDDEDSRRVATKFLVDRGMRVHECADGESGLAEMRLRPPDVVVLDLMMPVLDGFGVLAAMRADALLSGIPVVVLTAKTLTEPEREFLSRTAVRVLQKGEHRLADIAALVLRAASRTRGAPTPPAP